MLRAVSLDGMGTLLSLDSPGALLEERLRVNHGIECPVHLAERAFAAEILYYRAHHLQGRDAPSLADLRGRCAEVLYGQLPVAVAREISLEQMRSTMLECLRFRVYPDVRPALSVLRERGLVLLVVSNWDVSLAEILRQEGIWDLIDVVTTSAEVGHEKPAPEVFQVALDFAGVSPRQTVHVGDSLDLDIVGAMNAGISPVWLCRDGQKAPELGAESRGEALQAPIISSLDQLHGLLAQ